MKLKVMTYNIQHGNVHQQNYIDLTKMCDVIRAEAPDVVALNEVRGRGTRDSYTAQTEFMAANLGMHGYFGRSVMIGGTNPYGNAVLSKYPIVEARVIPIPAPIIDGRLSDCEPRSITRCVIGAPEGEFAVYVSHFGLCAAEHEHAVTTVLTLLAGERLPYVLMGDFNMRPDNPLLAPMHERLTSTDEMLAGKFSFPSHAPDRKIDYIFACPGAEVLEADIPQIMASDHCPVTATVEV